MKRFTWEEGSVTEYQEGLRRIFGNQPELKEKFSAFLYAPTDSETEQTAAKAKLCEIVGMTPQKRDANLPSIDDSAKFFGDLQVYILALKYNFSFQKLVANATLPEAI